MDEADAKPDRAHVSTAKQALPGSDESSSSQPPRTLPASTSEYCYKMNHGKRGLAIIVNNKDFHLKTGLGGRMGTDVDAAALEVSFRRLGFNVLRYDNLTQNALIKVFFEASQMDHAQHDLFACAILTHGEEGRIYGTDGSLPVDNVVNMFEGHKCKTLAGKPKLFFIQACRGMKVDHGTLVVDGHEDYVDGNPSHSYRIPSQADILIAYSTVPGYYSWRNRTNGSWFVQALCEELDRCNGREIMSVMTSVNRSVAYSFRSSSDDPAMNGKKQIPCITTMLTKELYFY